MSLWRGEPIVASDVTVAHQVFTFVGEKSGKMSVKTGPNV